MATAQTVINAVRRIVNDQASDFVSGLRWSDAELLRWITDGQREIVSLKPEANAVTDAFIVAGGFPRQRLSQTIAHRLIRVEANGVGEFEETSCEIYSINETMGTLPPFVRTVGSSQLVTFEVTPLDDGNQNRLLVAFIVADSSVGGDQIIGASVGGQEPDVYESFIDADGTGFIIVASLIDQRALTNYDIIVDVGIEQPYSGSAQVFTYGNVGGIFYQKFTESTLADGDTLNLAGTDGSAFISTLVFTGAVRNEYAPDEASESTFELVVPSDFVYAEEKLENNFSIGERWTLGQAAHRIGAGFNFPDIQWVFNVFDVVGTFGGAIGAFAAYSVCDLAALPDAPVLTGEGIDEDPPYALLTWTVPDSEHEIAYYRVQYRLESEQDWSDLGTYTVPDVETTDPDVSSGETWFYRVRAYTVGDIPGPFSNEVEVLIP